MKAVFSTQFSVDRDNCRINVERDFAARLPLVWAAWTQQDLLDRWWAPKPWQSRTKSMDFVEGGRRLYAMVGPEGEEHWALADYESIRPQTNFRFLDAFCDAEGKVDAEAPRSNWSVDFREGEDRTKVLVTIQLQKLADLEWLIGLGFREGFLAALENLDEELKG